jgi:effector-binding domain-containing protein
VIHSESFESDRLDIELGAVLSGAAGTGAISLNDRMLRVHTLPAISTMATVLRIGGFEQNCRSYGAIGMWVEDSGYRIAGPGREVLIQPPRADSLDDMVTEIQFPVEPSDNAAAI